MNYFSDRRFRVVLTFFAAAATCAFADTNVLEVDLDPPAITTIIGNGEVITRTTSDLITPGFRYSYLAIGKVEGNGLFGDKTVKTPLGPMPNPFYLPPGTSFAEAFEKFDRKSSKYLRGRYFNPSGALDFPPYSETFNETNAACTVKFDANAGLTVGSDALTGTLSNMVIKPNSASIEITSGRALLYENDLVRTDFNSDGRTDILLAKKEKAKVLLQAIDGTFAAASKL
jgi:hypothetical protein